MAHDPRFGRPGLLDSDAQLAFQIAEQERQEFERRGCLAQQHSQQQHSQQQPRHSPHPQNIIDLVKENPSDSVAAMAYAQSDRDRRDELIRRQQQFQSQADRLTHAFLIQQGYLPPDADVSALFCASAAASSASESDAAADASSSAPFASSPSIMSAQIAEQLTLSMLAAEEEAERAAASLKAVTEQKDAQVAAQLALQIQMEEADLQRKEQLGLKTEFIPLAPELQASIPDDLLSSGMGTFQQLPDEQAAIKNKVVARIPILPSKQFTGAADDMHFRLAESQFLRMCGPLAGSYQVEKVELVVNPALLHRYESFKRHQVLKGQAVEELLMWHGTSSPVIDKIVMEGFRIGGEDVPIASGAVYGKGVYVSEESSFAINYIKDGSMRLLFAKCCPSEDTHRVMSAGGNVIQQMIMKKREQVLPFYIVHLKARVAGACSQAGRPFTFGAPAGGFGGFAGRNFPNPFRAAPAVPASGPVPSLSANNFQPIIAPPNNPTPTVVFGVPVTK